MTKDRLAALIGLAESRCYTHDDVMELLRAVEEEKAVADGLLATVGQLRRERSGHCTVSTKGRGGLATESISGNGARAIEITSMPYTEHG